MRHLALAAALAAGSVIAVGGSIATAADPSTDGLVISEYVEGSSFNKAVEIYNGTGSPVSLAGLEFQLYSNANTSPNATYAFPAVDLADGDVFVVTHPDFNDDEGFVLGGDVEATSSAINFNGDDAFTIVDTGSGAVIDSFKQAGADITNAANVTMRRTDFTRDTDPTDAWTDAGFARFGSNDVSELGLAPDDDGGGGEPPDPDPVCDTPDEGLTPISAIQGSGFDSPLHGDEVTVRAVVTLADPDLDGYFIQEEDADTDGDAATSEGLFVFDRRALPSEGQTVELTDNVTSFGGLTQLSFPDMEICELPLVEITPTAMNFPIDDLGREALEGMLVTNGQDLQVTGLFTAYRYGELGLAYNGPLDQPTSVYAPDDPQAVVLADLNAQNELKVNDRNEAFSQFNPYPWELFDEDLSAGDTMPAGRLVGALGYSFGEYKVEPLDEVYFPETDDTNARPDAPSLADGNDVATFNVLNYFNTFGSRGADNQEEFDLQEAKIVDAITRLDAAVVGLMEIENDYEDIYDDDAATEASIVTLVNALNAVDGKNTWDYIRPNENILTTMGDGGLGPDQIAVGIVYQRERASAIGHADTFDIDALLEGDIDNSRWPLAQTFRIDGEKVTVVVNHFKSKGSSCTDTAGPGFDFGDDVQGQFTGNCDLTRQYAANRLVEWVDDGATNVKTDNVLLVGDFNSYEEEAPIEILVDAGYVDLVQRDGDDAFTYKFSGRFGRLDYVFASSALADSATDAEVWQINSPAPYGYLYSNDPIDDTAHASSDHDPVVVSLR